MSDANCDPDKPDEQAPVDYDTMFEVLADKRRRLVLHHLAEDQSAELDELVDSVCDSVESDPPDVSAALHHNHLPRLDDAGILEYDSRSGSVRYYEHEPLEGILDWVAPEDLSE